MSKHYTLREAQSALADLEIAVIAALGEATAGEDFTVEWYEEVGRVMTIRLIMDESVVFDKFVWQDEFVPLPDYTLPKPMTPIYSPGVRSVPNTAAEQSWNDPY